MSINYNITTNFASKDALPDNDPGKVIRGSDFSAEFTAIQTAFLSASTSLSPTFTGTATFTTVDINGGTVDGTVIGASSTAAGSFTTVTASGFCTLPTVNIDGGNIDGTVIGGTVPAAITGTTVTGTSFVGPLTGNVTGNVTGNLTGDVVGDVVGNIIAVTGTSTFNNVTINGSLDMVAGTSATVTNLSEPVGASDAATKSYVDTGIANLVSSAPGTLDTLNELAAALNDDPNFSTTITNSIATKLPLAGGTMTGNVTFTSGKITGLPTPSATSDAVPKSYVDDNYLSVSGGSLLGALDLGPNRLTSSYVPTANADVANKLYVDGIAGSASAAAASAAAALVSENNAASSETAASNSASAALASEAAAATLYDDFDDRYLGAKGSAPTVDNDGNALLLGALYFDTVSTAMKVWSGSGWLDAYAPAGVGIDDNATATAITIDASQNVGIGTNSPTAKIHLAEAVAFDPTVSGGEGGNINIRAGTGVAAAEGALFGGVSLGSTDRVSSAGIAALKAGVNDDNIGLSFFVHSSNTQTAASDEAMRIDSSGNVGIGINAPTEKLHVDGNILATGNVTAYSDERLKSDIKTLDGSKVYEMRGVSYTKDGEASSGVIAQELQKVAPELVNDSGEYLSVAYGNVVGYLIEAVKDLKAEVEALKESK